MSTFELYLGGPSTANVSRAMFPAPTFSASAAAFLAMRPSLHKGNFLNRVLDFANDKALQRFVADQAAASDPITTGDVLGLLVIPKNIAVRGCFYEVEDAGGAGLILTPSFRVASSLAQAAIACDALSAGAVGIVGGSWATTVASCQGDAIFMATPDMLDLAVTAIGAGFGSLRLNIGLWFDDLTAGQY